MFFWFFCLIVKFRLGSPKTARNEQVCVHPQQTAKFRTAFFGQFRTTLRTDSVANASSLDAIFDIFYGTRLTLDPAGMYCPSRDDAFVSSVIFWARRDSIEPNSYGDVAGWVSVTAGIVSKRLNLSENFLEHLVAPSLKHLGPLTPMPHSKGNPFIGGVKYTGGVGKLAIFVRFSTYIAVYLGNGAR